MRRQGRTAEAWRRPVWGILAGVLAIAAPGVAAGQSPGTAIRAVPGVEDRARPATAAPDASGSAASLPLDPAPPRLRLYSPSGSDPEPLRAAVLADLSRNLQLNGRAVYHPRPAMTVLDVEARIRATARVSLSLRLVSRHRLPGRPLPLQYRGREQRAEVGLRLPLL